MADKKAMWEAARDKLEPEARNLEPAEAAADYSKAISAKRQADALERIASAFDGQQHSGNVLYWLEIIASAANAGRS